jgi:hypothetical protein
MFRALFAREVGARPAAEWLRQSSPRGDSSPFKSVLRVGFWGALAMAVTAGIGALIGKAV